MTESLPISITSEAGVTELFPKIAGILNKLEAQLNFQSLTAGWYGDEENILTISIALVLPQSFTEQSAKLSNKQLPADDVAFSIDTINVDLLVAITQQEQAIITEQPKLLQRLIQLKLIKATNLVAEKQQLTPLPE